MTRRPAMMKDDTGQARQTACWCAQDIKANWFWESLGSVPLAFRTGSRSKQRTRIFWQKRIREGDTSTPWWFPPDCASRAPWAQ